MAQAHLTPSLAALAAQVPSVARVTDASGEEILTVADLVHEDDILVQSQIVTDSHR